MSEKIPNDDERTRTAKVKATQRLAAKMRRIRESRGWSFDTMAEALGVTAPTIERLEEGDVTDWGMAVKAILVFDLDANALVFGQKIASTRRQRDAA